MREVTPLSEIGAPSATCRPRHHVTLREFCSPARCCFTVTRQHKASAHTTSPAGRYRIFGVSECQCSGIAAEKSVYRSAVSAVESATAITEYVARRMFEYGYRGISGATRMRSCHQRISAGWQDATYFRIIKVAYRGYRLLRTA